MGDFPEELDKGANATSKLTYSSVVNNGSTCPGKTLGDSDYDCKSYLKNGSFHQFESHAIMRT